MGGKIWVKVGDPAPTDPKELTFLLVDTRTPYVVDYPGEVASARNRLVICNRRRRRN